MMLQWELQRAGRREFNKRFKSPKGTAPMSNPPASADFVTAFATGWPENQPDILVLSLTTHKGVQNFAINKEQALLIAKTIKQTAARLAQPRKS